MNTFFRFFYEFMSVFFDGLSSSIKGLIDGISKMFNFDEYARIIDDYMTQFGYKVNSLKVPNITGRPNWNYVKTQGCNITGDIPQSDVEEIKALFNRGITIWHNPNTFLDYSQNNQLS